MKVRILLVDDDPQTLREYTKDLLKGIKPRNRELRLTQGITEQLIDVEVADLVSIAIKKLQEQRFELLVVDLKIRGLSGDEMGGLEVVAESVRLDPLRPIIVITGFGTVELVRQMLARGVFDFIEKSDKAINELIESVQRAIEYLDEKIKRSGNPFIPMTGMGPSIFGGRSAELEFFEQRLNRALYSGICEHFLVLGDWGIGKTSLLREYRKICQGRGNLATVVPIELPERDAKLIDIVCSILEGILSSLPYPIDKFGKLLEFFESVGITIPVLGGGVQFKRDTSKQKVSPQTFLHNGLLKLWKDLEDKTEAFAIFLDDLDNLTSIPEMMMTLKTVLSMESIRNTKILVGMASTTKTWQELTTNHRHHPLTRYFLSRIELGPLSRTELESTIQKSLHKTGVSFSKEVIDRVFEYTKGHPFEFQVLCYQLFDNQLSRRVEISVWEKALQSTLKDLGLATFDHWIKESNLEERKLLQIIAKVEKAVSLEKIAECLSKTADTVIPFKAISKDLESLSQRMLICQSEDGCYSIRDQMFRAFLCFY